MQRGGAPSSYWRSYTPQSERHVVYNSSGYPVGPTREYLFGSGVQEGRVESVEPPVTPKNGRSGGSSVYRSEPVSWRPYRKSPYVGQPVTLTVKPPRSQTIYTIQQGTTPPSMPTLPKQPFRPTRDSRRIEPMDWSRKRPKVEPPTSLPRPNHTFRKPSPTREPTEQEPGEIVERKRPSVSSLQWCTHTEALSDVPSSLRGGFRRERPWTAVGFVLRDSVVPREHSRIQSSP